MTEIQRLAAAIKTISEKYLTNVVKSGDKAGIAKWSLRLADYSTRLAVLVSPALAKAEIAELEVPEPLSSDPSVARAQILAATGHPLTFDETGQARTLDPEAVLKDASPEQNAQLALLGFFGNNVEWAAVDWSLFLKYYEPQATGGGDWQPKAPYFDTGTWPAYVATLR